MVASIDLEFGAKAKNAAWCGKKKDHDEEHCWEKRALASSSTEAEMAALKKGEADLNQIHHWFHAVAMEKILEEIECKSAVDNAKDFVPACL